MAPLQLQDFLTTPLRQHLTLLNLFGAVIATFILYLVYNFSFHPLHRVPGPTLAKFGDTWKFKNVYYGTFAEALDKLHQ